MTNPASRISDEIVEQARAWEPRNGDARTATHLPEWWREVLEAVRPEPTFTPEERRAFDSLVDHWKQEFGERSDGGTYFGKQHDLFESIRSKMEAMRDGTS